MRSRKYKKGFAWVELTIVVVIVSVCVLIGFSRYLDFFGSKDESPQRLIAEAFENSVNLINSKWLKQSEHSDTIEINGRVIEVTPEGWVKQLNDNVKGCVVIWNQVLSEAPLIEIYDADVNATGWSVGGGSGVCYFLYQNSNVFNDDETPYFSYISLNGKVARFNM